MHQPDHQIMQFDISVSNNDMFVMCKNAYENLRTMNLFPGLFPKIPFSLLRFAYKHTLNKLLDINPLRNGPMHGVIF